MNATNQTLDTLNARVTPADLKRVAVEQYKDGTGWFAHSPRGGSVGQIWASAATKTEILNWAQRKGLQVTVF